MSKRQPTPCAPWAELLAQASFGHLSAEERTALQAHLAVCPACAAMHTTYLQTATLLLQLPDPDPLPGLPPQLLQAWAAEGQRTSARRQIHPEYLQEVFMQTIHQQTPPSLPPKPHTWRQQLGHRTAAAMSVVAALVVIAVIITGIVASRGLLLKDSRSTQTGSSNTGSASTPAGTPYVSNSDDILQDIQMFSSSEGWVVGGTYTQVQGAGVFGTLALHYTNGQWLRVATPTNVQLGVHEAELLSVAMISPDEGWAVGFTTNPGSGTVRSKPMGVILHYKAGKWTKFSSISDAEFYQVRMLSPTDGWIAGGGGWDLSTDTSGATKSLLLHYDGRQWTPAQVPNVAGIHSLDLLSATDGWATGTNAVLHYDGKQWSIFQQMQGVAGLSMDSATDGWAVGHIDSPDNPASSANMIWHYNGSQWGQGTLPSAINADAEILGLSMDSTTDGWAIGYGNGGKKQTRYALYLHYINGQWTQVQGPGNNNLNSVSMLSANEGWAVGNSGALMHYQYGSWSQYHF